MNGAIFCLTILPIIIILLSFVVFFVSRPEEKR
jgi:preprotein translocase subunit YajC